MYYAFEEPMLEFERVPSLKFIEFYVFPPEDLVK